MPESRDHEAFAENIARLLLAAGPDLPAILRELEGLGVAGREVSSGVREFDVRGVTDLPSLNERLASVIAQRRTDAYPQHAPSPPAPAAVGPFPYVDARTGMVALYPVAPDPKMWYRLVRDIDGAVEALKAGDPSVIVPDTVIQRGLAGGSVAHEIERERAHQYEGPGAIWSREPTGEFRLHTPTGDAFILRGVGQPDWTPAPNERLSSQRERREPALDRRSGLPANSVPAAGPVTTAAQGAEGDSWRDTVSIPGGLPRPRTRSLAEILASIPGGLPRPPALDRTTVQTLAALGLGSEAAPRRPRSLAEILASLPAGGWG